LLERERELAAVGWIKGIQDKKQTYMCKHGAEFHTSVKCTEIFLTAATITGKFSTVEENILSYKTTRPRVGRSLSHIQ
jgi:hypothetical protein